MCQFFVVLLGNLCSDMKKEDILLFSHDFH
jgi:hypothetical protein